MAKSAVDRSSSEFHKSLIRYGKKVKRRAAGRTCGTCCFYLSTGLCIVQDIEIYYNQAIACKRHELRE